VSGAAAAGAEPVHLAVHGLSKEYPSRAGAIRALSEVAFAVRRGEFVSIIGPSGCGKSTLLKIILGVVPGATGQVEVGGTAGDRIARAAIGMVFQTPSLLPWRRVLDNVLLPIDALGLSREAYRDRARALLGLVGLSGFEARYPRELSGGMQQRVSLCRALIHEPDLLLMDEPFGALDALTREEMQVELLRVWRETAKTVLFVTHSIDEAVLLSDRVLVMTPRPGRMTRDLAVDLPRPRTADLRASPRFQAYAHELRQSLGRLPT
jgi:NitT/TauT family transport system ATP-binding protein